MPDYTGEPILSDRFKVSAAELTKAICDDEALYGRIQRAFDDYNSGTLNYEATKGLLENILGLLKTAGADVKLPLINLLLGDN